MTDRTVGKSMRKLPKQDVQILFKKSDRTDSTWIQKHINDSNHLIYKYNCKLIQVATYQLAEVIVQISHWIDALYSSKKAKGT